MRLKQKTILRYALVLLIGIISGWLVFGSRPEPTAETMETGHMHDSSMTASDEHAEAGTVEIWTCSMHPQIRQNEPGDCPICGMDLIPLAQEQTEESSPYQLVMSENAVRLANVQTTPVTRQHPERKLSLNGKIEVNEQQIRRQTAHFPGRVEQMLITYEGQAVERGQIIAYVYSPPLVTAQRELLEAARLSDTNPTLLSAAKRKLKLWKLSDRQIQRIIDEGEIITNWPIRADVAGRVSEINVETGGHVQEGTPFFTVANLDEVWAVFEVYENQLAWLSEGDSIRFTVAAYPARTFTGKITFVDPFIHPQTRVALVRTEVDNSHHQLKPKMFAQGTVIGGEQPASGDNSMVVPKSAVLWTGPRSIVYIKVNNTTVPTYEMREIALGPSLGDQYIVENGLKEGDAVVTNGAFTVDAAAQLNNKSSMMNREAALPAQQATLVELDEEENTTPDFTASLPSAFREQMQQLLLPYLAMKDALVASDAATAQKQAQTLVSRFSQIDTQALAGEAATFWKEHQSALLNHAQTLQSASKVDTQRRHFKPLSSEMIMLVRAFGTDQPLYVQHCPMADNDEGADWLSVSEAVKNPYYGDMMLTCGNVSSIINP
uniref:Efflux RND transporter periplasmic adaptor subunit n=1 Tax=Roseihalotalea indica TaxID=2867963 RepID=A0AA49GN19_9BACT|nr:efflux RND transporter periplasmic adaptor subunit [Tunicatimonas sp. TK19036]